MQQQRGPLASRPLLQSGDKRQLIGYYVLDCKDDQEVNQLAATIPAASIGTVEVHPVFQM